MTAKGKVLVIDDDPARAETGQHLRESLLILERAFGARAIAIRKDFIVFETTGHREETNKLMKALEPFGLVEFVRSARVAIIKESSGFHEKLKDFENREPSEEVIENEYLGKREAVFTM